VDRNSRVRSDQRVSDANFIGKPGIIQTHKNIDGRSIPHDRGNQNVDGSMAVKPCKRNDVSTFLSAANLGPEPRT
jgi:hypothetical protein